MRFIKLTRPGNNSDERFDVFVNPACILRISPRETRGSNVVMVDDKFSVDESPWEIMALASD